MKASHFLLAGVGGASAFLQPIISEPSLSVRLSSPISTAIEGVTIRPAFAQEQGTIQRTIAGMLMNPLSIDTRNFVCAEEKDTLIGFGQVRSIGGSDYELASVYVAESYRQRGIGSILVRRLVEDFVKNHGREELRNLHLLTLADTASFYERSGFEVLPPKDVPAVLKAERAVGSFIQSFFGNSLVCMRGVPD